MKIFTSTIIAIAALMTFTNNIQSADVLIRNDSSATSRPLLPPDRVTKEEINFEQTFQGCNNRKYGCVIIQGTATSSCRGKCMVDMQQLLINEGFVTQMATTNNLRLPSACVGYRTDLGGDIKGAQYLANRLAARLGVKYVVSSITYFCSANGWPYSVLLH